MYLSLSIPEILLFTYCVWNGLPELCGIFMMTCCACVWVHMLMNSVSCVCTWVVLMVILQSDEPSYQASGFIYKTLICNWMPKGIILSKKVSPVTYSDIFFSLMLKLQVCVFEWMHLETFWAMRWSRDTLVFLALLASQKTECFVNGKFCPALPFSLRPLIRESCRGGGGGMMRKRGERFSIRGKKTRDEEESEDQETRTHKQG